MAFQNSVPPGNTGNNHTFTQPSDDSPSAKDANPQPRNQPQPTTAASAATDPFDDQPLNQMVDPDTTTTASAAPDPFDPVSLRLSQNFGVGVGVKKLLLSVPVRKPDKAWFVRVHPDPAYRLQTAVVELKEDRDGVYLVAPDLWPELATESTFSPRLLAIAINRQGVVFLWPVKLPGADGRVDDWSRTALEAVELATKNWVRVQANMALGSYEVFEATGNLPDPEWPVQPFRELLRVAFKDRLINTLDHPVLRRLRGEV